MKKYLCSMSVAFVVCAHSGLGRVPVPIYVDCSSTVNQGCSNSISGSRSTISGGYKNEIENADGATIGGGTNNYIYEGDGAVVGGGFRNYANGYATVVAGGRGNYIETETSYSAIAGGHGNQASSDYVSIGGGLANTVGSNAGGTIGGGSQNTIHGRYGTIAGGAYNQISDDAHDSSIGGGRANFIEATCQGVTIAGGVSNRVSVYDDDATNNYATIGGGYKNEATYSCSTVAGGSDNDAVGPYTTVGGGKGNYVETDAAYSTIAGGQWNQVYGHHAVVGGGSGNQAGAHYSTVPGGRDNFAEGDYSLAAGYNAYADHNGAFIWADSTGAQLQSTTNNQFLARASGGVKFFSNAGATTGVRLSAGSGSWSSLSDRESKDNIECVDGRDVLNALSKIEIAKWSYKSQDGVTHMGPMAQDFHKAFGVGEDEKNISNVDADGVALAAIQGLHDMLKEKDTQIEALSRRLADLEKQITK